jgi:hypothetical protein
MSPPTEVGPTQRQLSYLRVLAAKSATTFSYPQTRGQASREIDRLLKLGSSPDPSPLEDRETNRERLHYATAVQAEEVSGYGSSATWRSSAPRARRTAQPKHQTPHRTELARYRLSGGERVLHGQQLDAGVRITDRPASGTGPSYVVEHELEQDAYPALMALLADYIEHARECDEVPMASAVIRRLLDAAPRGA